jgi:hypothetical protein
MGWYNNKVESLGMLFINWFVTYGLFGMIRGYTYSSYNKTILKDEPSTAKYWLVITPEYKG